MIVKLSSMHLVGVTSLAIALALVQVATVVAAQEDDDGGVHWALLVAGSNTFMNYRHQADICHAYHIVSKNGIPDERIIVMMYDDIAYNPKNPLKGNIINEPNGTNIYPGVPKDYTGKEIRPDVFLKVLTGDAEGVKKILGRPGKVINSGPKDRIFVNFADHGAPGLLGFPVDVLHGEDLHKAIRKMHRENRYKQMVFYVEACESGSIFQDLESNINVFATTAANPDQSSYACYFDETRHTYLGDVYSVKWMEDSDTENLSYETLKSQYELVKTETTTSQVMEYGDLNMGKLKVADFQGKDNLNVLRFTASRKIPDATLDAVPSEQVPLEIMRRRVKSSSGAEKEKSLKELEELEKRKKASELFFYEVFRSLGDVSWFDYFLGLPVKFTDYKCYRECVRLIQDLCPGMKLSQNDFALRKLRVLANVCETELAMEKIWRAIAEVAPVAEICN